MPITNSKTTNKPNSIKWSPQMSAPLYFTIDGIWLYVKYGFNSAVTPYLGGTELLHSGMAKSRQLDRTIKSHIPKGVDLVWASWSERKWYAADVNFTFKEKQLLKRMLKSTFPSYDNFHDLLNPQPKIGSYDIFNTCIFPGGKIHYYLSSSDYNRIICLDMETQAKETHAIGEDFLYGGTGIMVRSDTKYWDTMDEFFDNMLFEGKYHMPLDSIEEEYDIHTRKRTELYRKFGAPKPSLWEPYFRRYNYKVSVQMEDAKSKLWNERCTFTNAEMYERFLPVNPDNIIDTPSPLANINFKWDSNDYAYTSNIYFNEEETFQIFQNAFASNPDSKGELQILVSKNNGSISASLIVNEKSYKFNKVQIDIEQCKEHYLIGKIIYKNYKDPHQEFIGQ